MSMMNNTTMDNYSIYEIMKSIRKEKEIIQSIRKQYELDIQGCQERIQKFQEKCQHPVVTHHPIQYGTFSR